MTTGPTALPLPNSSILGISAGALAAVAAGSLCKWAGLPDPATTTVTVLALSVPPAVELKLKSRHRNTAVEIARLQRGELHRPVGLVVILLAALINLLDSAPGLVTLGIATATKGLNGNIAKVLTGFGGGLYFVSGMCLFLATSYASHFLARRPYLWTAIAVGCALLIRELIVMLTMQTTDSFKGFIKEMYGSSTVLLLAEAVGYLSGILFVCMVGVRVGGSYHEAFLAKKLARTKSKAPEQDPSTPQSQTSAETHTLVQGPPAPQDSAPKLATLIGESKDLLSASDGHHTSDPMEQIEKLARLRDMGALTEEEFQAKKTEILVRI
jgi:hypothetical protein